MRFSLVTHGRDSPEGLRDVLFDALKLAHLSKQTA